MAKFDLITQLTLNSAGFTQGIDRAKKSTQGFQSTIKGMAGFIAPLIGVGAALGTLKSSLNAVEGTGDRFAAAVGGGKEALFEFQRALATMDFSNFLSNLKEGFTRGKEFTKMLDELADATAYSDYKISSLKREQSGYEEIAKDKTKEIKVRAEAAEKIKEIAQQIYDRQVELAQKTFDVEKRSWEGRNKMSVDEAIKLYETIDNLSSEQENRLAKSFEYQTKLFGKKKGVEMILSGEAQRGMLKGIPEEVIQSYGKYFKLLETGEAEVLPKLFSTSKKLQEAQFTAQEELNGAVAMTSKLFVQEEKDINKTADALAKLKKETTGIKKVSLEHLMPKKPDSTTLKPMKPVVMAVVWEWDELGLSEKFAENWKVALGEIGSYVDNVAGAFMALGDAIVNASADGKVSFAEAMNIIIQSAMSAISILAALAAAQIITKEASKGLIGIATALIGLAALASIWTAFVKPKPMALGGLSQGGLTLVGERGAELIDLPSGSRVYSNPESRRMMGGGEVVFRIEGDTLVGVLNNNGRRKNSYR
jgi:hypothetical protein